MLCPNLSCSDQTIPTWAYRHNNSKGPVISHCTFIAYVDHISNFYLSP